MPTSRNPYHQKGQAPHVLRSIVIYMDVLGYGEMAKRAETEGKQDAFLAKLYEALSESRKWLRDDELNQEVSLSRDFYAMKAFTDNIIIGWPLVGYGRGDGEAEFGSAFFNISGFQLAMANAGFFVRGAISFGDAYVDDV